MIKIDCSLVCLALIQQLSFAWPQAGQATNPSQIGEHHWTPEQRAEMDRLNVESVRVYKVVLPLLNKARALSDSGDPVTASRYYEKASSNERLVDNVSADLITEESLVSQGRYREAAGIGQQYGPTVGPPIWLIVSDCELGQFDEAEKLVAANSGSYAGLLRSFAYGVPANSEHSHETLKAMAWFLVYSTQWASHTPQAQFNWLKRAHSFSKHNALIELRMAQLLNGPLKQPAQALALLEDAKRQIGATQFTINDPMYEVGLQYDIAVGLIRTAAFEKKSAKD